VIQDRKFRNVKILKNLGSLEKEMAEIKAKGWVVEMINEFPDISDRV